MTKKQIYCANLVLEKRTFSGSNFIPFLGWFYFVLNKDEATDMILKEPKVIDALKQGYQVFSLDAFVVPPTIAPINGSSWSVNRYTGQRLLSFKLDDFPKEAIADLQRFADKWLDGYKL